jgi:uncharacterized protein
MDGTQTLFTPLASTLGGGLIGLSAGVLLLFAGRIAGISGILGGAFFTAGDRLWRFAFLGGLVAGGALLALLAPSSFSAPSAQGTPILVAGLLVGFGTQLGSGCTSGHGVCGLPRLSLRSLAATGTFMVAGAAAVLAVRLLGGGS